MSTVETQDKRRGGRVLLISSLVLNVFLIFLIAGAWVAGVRAWRERGPLFGLGGMEMREVVDTLPDAMQTKFRESMRDSFPEIRASLSEARSARAAVSDALESEPFDIERLKQAFVVTRTADDKVRDLSTQAFTEFVAKLDETEREVLVQAIKDSRKNFGRRDRMGGPPRPGFDDGDAPPDAPPADAPQN